MLLRTAALVAAARRARAVHTTGLTPPPSTSAAGPVRPRLPPPPPSRPLHPPALAVWGADTDIGKTLVCAGLARVASHRGWRVLYVKPVQTGYPGDDDARSVARGGGLVLAQPGEHARELCGEGGGSTPHHTASPPCSYARTLTAWRTPTSPHAAVASEGRGVTSADVAAQTATELSEWAHAVTTTHPPSVPAVAFIETAGGPLSPSPDGVAQADAWGPLRLPPLLVASPRLGGVSTTLAAAEALSQRGHTPLAGVIVAGAPPEGHVDALRAGLPAGTPLVHLPPCPPPPADWVSVDAADPTFIAWADGEAREGLERALDASVGVATAAATDLASLTARAAAVTWWPFTQHDGLVPARDVMAIDGRAGEHYMTLAWKAGGGEGGGGGAQTTPTTPHLIPLYDACASWWTQGAHGAAGGAVRRAIAGAIGRYGHVIHPRSANEPAVKAAEALLEGPGKGWAGKVFWSDDGSTAIEVGLKMAFRAAAPRVASARAAAAASPSIPLPVTVLTVDGCYHGDTLAAMDATPPSVFNERQTPWYSGRALALAPPTAGLSADGWTVRVPKAGGASGAYDEHDVPGGLADLFSEQWAGGSVAQRYRDSIDSALDAHEAAGAVVGAALFEPVLQGAGGMRLIDPAWQIAFVHASRARSIPVVADEVFSGLWRLGAVSGCGLLGVTPDIAAFAKLLTGGLLPLAATLATNLVFESFKGGGTSNALLHGHSYSAHAAGCGAAAAALPAYTDPTLNPAICVPGRGCGGGGAGTTACACSQPCGRLAPLWCEEGLAAISRHPSVDRAFAIGTVLAAHLRVSGDAGYASTASAGVVARLAQRGVYARPLGDAVYIMRAPTSEPGGGAALQEALLAALDG